MNQQQRGYLIKRVREETDRVYLERQDAFRREQESHVLTLEEILALIRSGDVRVKDSALTYKDPRHATLGVIFALPGPDHTKREAYKSKVFQALKQKETRIIDTIMLSDEENLIQELDVYIKALNDTE